MAQHPGLRCSRNVIFLLLVSWRAVVHWSIWFPLLVQRRAAGDSAFVPIWVVRILFEIVMWFVIRRAVLRFCGCFRLFVFFYSVRKICANIVGESPKFSSEFSSGRAVAPLRGRALPGLYAERTDYRLSTLPQSIVDSRFVRHKAQGVLAHILGRLPCSKKTPKKIWNSMLAQCRYRMKIRKAGNICRIINCPTKICKDRHKLANCNAIHIYYHTGKIQFAEASTALHYQKRKIPQNRNPLQNSGKTYVDSR